MTIRLASLDMAGTTIDEGGAVYRLLRRAVETGTGRTVPDDLLSAWSGTSKFEAIQGLLGALGEDVGQAPAIFAAFSAALSDAYADEPPTLLPGVRDAVAHLRADGVAVVLQTGYTAGAAQQLLDAVGWRVGEDLDGLVTTEAVRASRPAPYLIFRTMEVAGVTDVAEVLVAGDTVNDLRAGTQAGARYVIGVLTGAHTAADLGRARHTHVLASVADVPALLEADGALERALQPSS